ncbi:hypothetical protein [Blastopirellula marina]|uniref:Uncharacterized protein n=1 Tax=Blastopirellula marina TaxID=124 RepID=A0A2S8GG36_9BACT|nr:hypothetical protein [Blastopirellula marina]PQO43437.1 hypothetical protein C5Y98_00565 [Blastopirellula marina]PTL46751.1 hypothetical protein C5Y97_00565 [Blastopirellula marina]
MIPLDDARWGQYRDALGDTFECGLMLRELLSIGPSEAIWDQCWNRLVYQDAIGEVSYAAVPYLANFVAQSAVIDWNALALISAVELARPTGPDVPPELADAYFAAIDSLPALLGNHPSRDWDELTARCAASCIALARGQRQLGLLYAEMSAAEGAEWLDSQGE